MDTKVWTKQNSLLLLKKNKIKLVADLRKTPLSRKPGFSKKRLAEGLALSKIAYIHLPGLGVPALWRKKAKLHLITRKKMFKDYVNKVIPEHEAEILILCENISKQKTALLCYEAEASDCHRHFVAIELQKLIKNLTVTDLKLTSVKSWKTPN